MKRASLTSIAIVLSTTAWVSLPDRTEASEWGCKVLLCASSSNPGWRGVPACHPPMYRLISAMKGWGFSWPPCPKLGLANRPRSLRRVSRRLERWIKQSGPRRQSERPLRASPDYLPVRFWWPRWLRTDRHDVPSSPRRSVLFRHQARGRECHATFR